MSILLHKLIAHVGYTQKLFLNTQFIKILYKMEVFLPLVDSKDNILSLFNFIRNSKL
jgi:hypothetical protein